MSATEINTQLREKMKGVLYNAYGSINREAWDRWLIRNAISEQIKILESMQLDQPPAFESVRILRLLLTALMNCEPEDVPEAGGRTRVGIYTMRKGIESVIAVLPQPLADLWSRELQVANQNNKELLDAVQKEHDQIICKLEFL